MQAFRSQSRKVYFIVLTLAVAAMITAAVCGQTPLVLFDDDFAKVGLPFAFPYCGTDYNSVFVGSNGFVTFGAGDTDFSETVADLRDLPPRIAPLWVDLNPDQDGVVTTEVVAGDFVVTWAGVPQNNAGDSNTFALTLRDDGSFSFIYGNLDATGGLVGISPGLGAITGDPGEIDLSVAAQPISGTPGDAVYELFSAGDNDLSGQSLEWDPCPAVEFLRPALPGVCYGTTGQGGASPGSLLTIDTTSGAATVVGPTSLNGVPGLAIDSFGRIFGTERATGNLCRIDAETGQAFFVATVVPFIDFLDGIAFDENDVLYAVGFDPPDFTLLTIDTFTGATTPIGPTDESISGLAFDPTDGQLYGSVGGFGATSPDGIVRIDKDTGASVVIGTTGQGGATPDLMFDESGNLFGTKGGGGGGASGGGGSPNSLISIDKTDGSGALVGLTGVASVSGLACALPVPEEDTDGDGVLDEDDLCPDTVIPEGVPTEELKANRWALVDEDGVFDTGASKGKSKKPVRSFTIEDTKGCSCEQIIEILDLGKGHEKFGCNTDAMDQFIDLVNP